MAPLTSALDFLFVLRHKLATSQETWHLTSIEPRASVAVASTRNLESTEKA